MSTVIQYKCPSCGADMAFDTQTGMLRCDNCARTERIENMPKPGENEDETIHYNMDEEDINAANAGFDHAYADPSDTDEPSQHSTFEEKDAREYHCNNCGAVLITEANTAATTCSFCGAGVVLNDRLSGNLAPSKVIPFSISKEQAQDAFKKWCKKGRLTPSDFMTADRIKNITGLYIPFWLYDMNGRGEAEATCTRVRTYSDAHYIYTETKYYNVYRKVDLNYSRIPCDASRKMEDHMMDKLEPYPYENLKDFNLPYLAGYIAEKYDFTDEDMLPRIKERVGTYVDNYLSSTISGYQTVSYHRKDINIRKRHADYTLMPVWMVCYDYRKTEHIFLMNGQTGKIIGKPPLSKTKMLAWFSGVSAGCFLLFQLLTLLGGALS